MIDKLAGYKTQIRVLEKKLKELDHTKLNPSKVNEITEAIKNLKELVQEKEQKREERRKAKEEKAKEVEASPKVEDGTVVMPKKEFVEEHEKLVKELEPMVEEHKEQGAELKEVKEASPKCAICGVEFKSYSEYNQHRVDVHGATREYSPMDPLVKKDIVKDVEHKLGPAIISSEEPKAELYKYSVDDKVEPVRGERSVGRVMRHDQCVRHKETGKKGIVISHE